MFKIKKSEFIAPDVKKIEIEAPKIAQKRKAGQFVVLRINEKGERIPLTIADSTDQFITIICQGIGKTTKELNSLKSGDSILDLVGPLGKPSEIERYGVAVVIGGGVGAAIAYPTAKALRNVGNYVISIIGGRSKEYVILENEMNEVSDEVYPTTDDGSYGYKGFVTQKLQDIIDARRKIDYVLAIGPIPMMNAIAEITRPHGIKTTVSLNPIMVDGTGMCGGCRAQVDNKTVFVCVDGPEFDAHKVDFELLKKRNSSYKLEEAFSKEHSCQLNEEIKKAKMDN